MLHAFEWFAYGFVAGYFWYPFWEIIKKVISEAKKAKQEWRNPQ
jgi:hypothetical protein